MCDDALGHLVQHEHVGRIPQVVVGLDHQQFGLQPGAGEVPLGGGVSDVGRSEGGM